MKSYFKYICFALFGSLTMLTSCQEDTESFDSKVYINTGEKVSTLLLKGSVESLSRTIQTAIPQPVNYDVNITFKGEPALVDQYNMAHYDKAIALPAECYSIAHPAAVIPAGGVKSTEVEITFTNLDDLDRDLVYVLPVTIDQSNIAVLESARTAYYVVKGAALINTVANIDMNKLNLNLSNADALNNLSAITVEGLVYVEKFDKLISTIMGIEGTFLIRIGDAGIPDSQLQLATANGNVTDASWTLPVRTWAHIAITYDTTTGATEFYLNGVKKGATLTCNYRRSINWGVSDFWIGRSYDDNRYLSGDVSEFRIWNRVLNADEINSKNHFYFVEPDAEGLVAYWKFDDGAGMTVKDHTANGNHARAANNLTWKPVELPN